MILIEYIIKNKRTNEYNDNINVMKSKCGQFVANTLKELGTNEFIFLHL